MKPFPPAQELSVAFTGDAIAQVWLDPHGVRFLFESKRQVYAQDDIEHVEADGTRWPYDCVGHSGPPIVLQRLLYKKVLSVDREDLCLTLRLEDGSSLAFHSELGPYESGHILSPEGDFTVY